MRAIQIFDPALSLLGEIAGYQSLRLCRKFCEVGEFELVLPLIHPMADRLAQDRILCPAGEANKAMLIERVVRDTGSGLLRVTGLTLSGLLRRRICVPPAAGADAYGYDRITGDVESVMRHYVKNNVTAPESEARRMDCVALEATNGHRGKKDVPWSARFEPLDELLTSIARYGDAGYAIEPDLTGKRMVFTFLPGRDRTGASGAARVLFGLPMGNVRGTTQTISAQQMKNAAVVGGAGEDENRLVLSVCPGEETGLERREMFVDAGSMLDPQALRDEGVRRIAEHGMTHAICAEVVQTPSSRYGMHWDLGDLVTVTTPHVQMNARIMQVQESHEAGSPVQLEVMFGTPPDGIERVIRERTRVIIR